MAGHQRYRIGWVGVGAMGGPLSRHLLKAGYELRAYDRVRDKTLSLVAEGAGEAASTQQLAETCDIVVSMVWDDDDVRDVVFGPHGLLKAARPGLRYIDMSTVSPKISGEIAAALTPLGIPYLRAPVSGSPPVAQAAKLSVYASGPRDLFDACAAILGRFGEKVVYVGAAEEGRVVKLAINLIVQLSTAVLGEALAFGERAGVDRSLLMDAINDSIVGCPHYRVRADSFKRRDLSYTGRWASPKDLGLALALASDVGAIMPMASLLQQYIRIITNRPDPQNGLAALTTLMEEINPVHPDFKPWA